MLLQIHDELLLEINNLINSYLIENPDLELEDGFDVAKFKSLFVIHDLTNKNTDILNYGLKSLDYPFKTYYNISVFNGETLEDKFKNVYEVFCYLDRVYDFFNIKPLTDTYCKEVRISKQIPSYYFVDYENIKDDMKCLLAFIKREMDRKAEYSKMFIIKNSTTSISEIENSLQVMQQNYKFAYEIVDAVSISNTKSATDGVLITKFASLMQQKTE